MKRHEKKRHEKDMKKKFLSEDNFLVIKHQNTIHVESRYCLKSVKSLNCFVSAVSVQKYICVAKYSLRGERHHHLHWDKLVICSSDFVMSEIEMAIRTGSQLSSC